LARAVISCETYTYNASTGNLETKAGATLTYNDAAHVHAVTSLSNGNTYQYDVNGNQTTRVIGSDTYTMLYDAENRLVEVKKNSVSMAAFVYDGDGRRVKSVVNGVTTYFAGGHYELTGSTVTKYYFAGSQRIAMRKYTIPQSMSVEYLLGDHLGSTSITTDVNGAKVSEMRYKPWGEVRYSWTAGPSTTPAYTLPSYTFTGQYSYMDDPSTTGVTEGFGLMFYGARMYDPAVGRFTSADTITLLPPKDAKHNNFFIALTVDFHETDILKYLNAVNYKDALENEIQPPEKDNQFGKQNTPKDDSTKKGAADLRKALQLEDRSTSYTQDESVETMSALNKIGKMPQANEQSKVKAFDKNRDLPFGFVYSNELDRYSYVKSCPSRYTDPSGHQCTDAQLLGAALLITVADLFVGIPLAVVIIMTGVVSPVAIAAEIGELVIVAINIGIVVWVANGCPQIGAEK